MWVFLYMWGEYMNIYFDESIKKFLDEKNIDEITVQLKGNPSCKGFEFNPVVGLYPPDDEDLENFEKENIENVDVYVDKLILKESKEIYLSYSKFGMVDNFKVDFK